MRVSLAAYRLMEEIAEVDRGVDREEDEVLAAYREALGITAREREALAGIDAAAIVIEGDRRQREEAVSAMASVAAADGRISRRERRRLVAVAQRLGLRELEAARLLAAAHRERRHHRLVRALERHRRGLLVATTALVLVAAWLGWIAKRDEPALAKGDDSLQAVAHRSDPSVVYVRVEYALVKDGERVVGEGEGTGFFVGGDGLLATCKHVVQPWKFLGEKVQLIEAGWEVDPDSIRYSAWPQGSRLIREGDLDRAEAWDTESGTLGLRALAPDQWVLASRPLPGGGHHHGRYHAMGNADLALLRATGGLPPGLVLAPADERPSQLDAVVVLGYPKGLALLEGERAIGAPSLGRVRRVEDSLLVNCDVYPGNSGGPCLSVDGLVVGIAARRWGGDGRLGRCIRVAHLLELIASAE